MIMNVVFLTLVAAACNVGTIACIKKCKHAVASGQPWAAWILGISITILATQFLLLWADIKGASLGLVVSFVIASVMIAAALMGVDGESGRLQINSLRHLPVLEAVGYGVAVLGVLLVGLSQQLQAAKASVPFRPETVAEGRR